MEIINNIIQTFKDEPLICSLVTLVFICIVWFGIEVYKAPIIEDREN